MKVGGNGPIRREHRRRRVHPRRPVTESDTAGTSIPHPKPSAAMLPAQLSWGETSDPIDHDALLGTILHRLRVRAGLTCEQAGRRSGLGPSRIAGLEEGDGLLLFTDAIPLLSAYGTNLAALARLLEASNASSANASSVPE